VRLRAQVPFGQSVRRNMAPSAAAAEWQQAHGGKRIVPGSIVNPMIDAA